MLKVAVLDDNKEFLNLLSKMLSAEWKRRALKTDTAYFSETRPFLEHLQQNNGVDLVFLDILLPDSYGVQVARVLQSQYPQTKVIFMSAVASTAGDIFEAQPSYFLTKPISTEKLCAAVSAVLQQNDRESFPLHHKGTIINIPKDQLEYVESDGRILHFCTLQKIYSHPGRLGTTTELLGGDFMRCHKSYTVNLRLVRQIEKLELILYSGRRIPIARSRLAAIKEKFFSYFRENILE